MGPAMALGLAVLLLAASAGTASGTRPVLTQPSSVLVRPGQTARLSCALHPRYNISQVGISWYQQRPGHPLRYLLYYNSEWDQHKSPEVPDRFSATKDPASNACILIIEAVQDEDNGNYYCALSHSMRSW